MDHIPVTEADCGQDIGFRVDQRVYVGDVVYREL
jgi:hypothetical protein